MDDEDLAEAEEARKVSTKDSYSALGSTEDEVLHRPPLMELLRPSGETMGVKLLRKMGWRDGQGIGPKIWRTARLDYEDGKENGGEKHLFAPENTKMISFVRKNDHKGLGFGRGIKLEGTNQDNGLASDEEDVLPSKIKPKKAAPRRNAIGIGILNDTGSDDEDPYSMGPKISYNRVVSGNKKKRKSTNSKTSTTTNSNPLLQDRHAFVAKRLGKTKAGFRKCHDGRLPLDGFVLSIRPSIPQENRYPPPTVPPDWKSSKSTSTGTQTPNSDPSKHQSTADLAKSSTHNPSTRGSLLGESSLPGKSVFSYLKPDARARIVALTNNTSLPAAGSEVLNPSASTSTSRTLDPLSLVPELDPYIASTALGRGVAGFVPYADNPDKLARYRAFLSFRAQLDPQNPSPAPEKPKEMSRDEWAAELNEFAHAATIFKPMTGVIASRFVTSSNGGSGNQTTSTTKSAGPGDKSSGGNGRRGSDEALRKKPADPAEDAAAMDMFGPLTRSTAYFYPTRLLCKRFDVPVPGHVNSGNEGSGMKRSGSSSSTRGERDRDVWASGIGYGEMRGKPGTTSAGGGGFGSRFASSGFQTGEGEEKLVSKEALEVGGAGQAQDGAGAGDAAKGDGLGAAESAKIDPERNEALEAERPGEEVFRAIFGSDDEDSD